MILKEIKMTFIQWRGRGKLSMILDKFCYEVHSVGYMKGYNIDDGPRVIVYQDHDTFKLVRPGDWVIIDDNGNFFNDLEYLDDCPDYL